MNKSGSIVNVLFFFRKNFPKELHFFLISLRKNSLKLDQIEIILSDFIGR